MKKAIYCLIGLAVGAAGSYIYLKKTNSLKKSSINILSRREQNQEKLKEQGPSKSEIVEATIENSNLSVSERADSRFIMDCYTKKAIFASDDFQFNDSVEQLWDIYWVLTTEPSKIRESTILYHKQRLNNTDLNKVVHKAVNGINLKQMIFKK